MDRYHLQRALQAAGVSRLEERSFLTGIFAVLAAVVLACVNGDPGGAARFMGSTGLAAIGLCAASRAVRLYRAGMTASLPTSVARVRMRIRPALAFSVVTVALSLLFPLAAGVALLALVDWAWFVVAVVLLFGCVGAVVPWLRELAYEQYYSKPPVAAEAILQRLCMRADMRAPELVVENAFAASAWTARGRIHVTRRLLELLDDAELEAVLAHEVAHLARRDAAVMDICSAPSRVLLGFARNQVDRLRRWTDVVLDAPPSGGATLAATIWVVGFVPVPPAYVVGWISRLSVLAMSRAREFSADAAGATLTGRPGALASALMKLDRQRDWTPRADLREVEPVAVLSIVGTARTGFGRLLSTHPPTAARVKRLEAAEGRMQAGPYAA